MFALEERTLENLQLENNESCLEEYYKILENMKINRIAKKVVEDLHGYSLNKIFNEIQVQENINRSSRFFEGDLAVLYPGIKEGHSRGYQTCDFSGAVIKPKSLYINYRPLIENLITKEVFVLKKTIKVEPAYAFRLPNTIIDLEDLEMKMQLEIDDKEIDFSHLNRQMGGEITLKKLRRINENRYNK